MLGFEVSWRKFKEMQVQQGGEGGEGKEGTRQHPTSITTLADV